MPQNQKAQLSLLKKTEKSTWQTLNAIAQRFDYGTRQHTQAYMEWGLAANALHDFERTLI